MVEDTCTDRAAFFHIVVFVIGLPIGVNIKLLLASN